VLTPELVSGSWVLFWIFVGAIPLVTLYFFTPQLNPPIHLCNGTRGLWLWYDATGGIDGGDIMKIKMRGRGGRY
jgi:hypothetical protein